MTTDFSAVYGKLRQKILAQNFAIGRHFRNNYMANGFNYGLYNLNRPSPRDRVLKVIRLVCQKKGPSIIDEGCELRMNIDGTLRPMLSHGMNDSGNQEWYIDMDYKLGQFSPASIELRTNDMVTPAVNATRIVGSNPISAHNITAPDVSTIFDDGQCRYELHYRVYALNPPEPGLLDDGGSLGDIQPLKDEPNDDWHIAVHTRENPLIASGLLLTCLAIEYYLGNQEAPKLIRSALTSIGSLFKFSGNHFDGYIIRWDAVTSDFWQEEFANGAAQPKRCLNFLTDKHGKYLYCTPFDSPDYVTDENEAAAMDLRWKYLVRYRHWEPSMDEINGLMMGYDAVYRFVNIQDIRDTVRGQASRLGDYLAEHAYLFVRPAGGFTERGSAGPNPAMEYPFSQAFQRITGNAYPICHSWEDAATQAGVWNQIQTSVNTLEAGYLAAAAVALPIGGGILSVVTPFLTPVLGLIGLALADIGLAFNISPFNLARAAAIYQNRDHFDVKHTKLHDSGERDSFALAYILLQLSPQQRTGLFLTGIKNNIGHWAKNFPRYWGVNTIQLPNCSNNSDPQLTNWYLDWNETFYQKWVASKTTDQDWWNGNKTGVILDCALALLNGGGPAYETRLIGMLNDDTQYAPPDGSGFVYDEDLVYLCAIAATWLYVKLQQEKGLSTPLTSILPLPNPSTWPAPSIPIAPDTYCVTSDAINQPISAYQDKKGRSVDFGVMTKGAQGGSAFILISFPEDYSPRPLESLQPNCNPNLLAVDASNQALVFAGDPPVQKSLEPAIHAPQPLQYRVLNSFSLSGDFNSTNLEVSILPDDCQFAYNQPAIVGLLFTPATAGQFSGGLTLATDNPYLSSLTITLNAQVVDPAAPQIHAAPLDFGEVSLGASQAHNVLVENVGNGLVYCSVNDQPLDQTPYTPVDQFKLQCALPYYRQIQPGESFEIPVEYTANVTGLAQARLEIEYNYAGHVPTRYELEVALQATGIGPALELSAHALDFHNDNPVRVEQHQTLTLTGKTICPVTVTQIYLEPLYELGFYINYEPAKTYSPLPVALPQNASLGVDILFIPINPGETYNVNLHILNDDLSTPEYVIPVTGGATGALARIICPDILDFGVLSLTDLIRLGILDHLINPVVHPIQPPVRPFPPNVVPVHPLPIHPPKPIKPPHITVRISSYGTSDLAVSQIYFDPSTDAFSLDGLPAAFPFTLPRGAEQAFDVDFVPKQDGTFETLLKIVSNDAFKQTYQVRVTGVCKP